MSINLLDLMQSALNDKVVGQVAGALGIDEGSVNKMIGGALPALLAGFIGKASTEQGAEQLGAVLDQADGTILDNIGDILGGADGGSDRLQEMGEGLISGLFGDKVDGILDLLSGASGLGKDKTGSLLGTIVPVIFSLLGKQKRGLGLDAAGFAKLLLSQKHLLKGVLPPGLSGILGLSGVDGDTDVATAAENLKDAVVNATAAKVDDVQDETANKIADVKSSASEALSSASNELDAAQDAAADKVADLKSSASEALSSASDKVDVAKGQAADKVADLKSSASDALSSASDKVDVAKDQAADKVADLKSSASDALSSASDKVDVAKDQAADKVADLKSSASDALSSASDKVDVAQDAAADIVADVKVAAASTANAAGKKVADVKASAEKATTAATSSGGGFMKLLIPVLIIGILGFLVWKFLLPMISQGGADVDLPAPSQITSDNVVKTMGTIIAKTTATLKSVKDEDSARAAVAELDGMSGQLSSIGSKINSLPDGVKAQLKKAVRGYGPKFNDLVEKAFAIPGVKPILEPKIDELIEKLTKFG